MTASLPDEIDRWLHELDRLDDDSAADGWTPSERCLAETQLTITSFRTHILPLLTGPQLSDVVVADEIAQLVSRLEDRRTDLYSSPNSSAAEREITELLSALRILARIARVPSRAARPR
jgi:hypothetical protein